MRGEKRSCGGSLSADGFTVRSGETRSCRAEGDKEGFTVRCCGGSGVGFRGLCGPPLAQLHNKHSTLTCSSFGILVTMVGRNAARTDKDKMVNKNWVVDMEERYRSYSPDIDQYYLNCQRKRWPNDLVVALGMLWHHTPHMAYFGPYHHGKDHLQLMEHHKERALYKILNRSGVSLYSLISSLEGIKQELMDSYDNLDPELSSDLFLRMMLLDGCFMLELLRTGDPDRVEPYETVFNKAGMVSITRKRAMEEDRLAWVAKLESRSREYDDARYLEKMSKTSIYKLPSDLINVSGPSSNYAPRMASFGPYHHGKPHLKPMEFHKERALYRIQARTQVPLSRFVYSLMQVEQQVRDSYCDIDPDMSSEAFLKMMLLDGCFMLELLLFDGRLLQSPSLNGGAETAYASVGREDFGSPNYILSRFDPIFSRHGKEHAFTLLRRDMLMLENQIPLLVLKRFLDAGKEGKVGNSVDLNRLIAKFFDFPSFSLPDLGLHVLDVYRKCIIRSPEQSSNQHAPLPFPKGIDLIGECVASHNRNCSTETSTEKGILRSKRQSGLNIKFSRYGVLTLPFIKIDSHTAPVYMNLIAFERMHPEAGCQVTSYVAFMDDLIDTAEDVSLLSSNAIVRNDLGSDDAAANLFNRLGDNIVLVDDPNDHTCQIKRQLKVYASSAWNVWRAHLRHTYFNNPWSLLSLSAAVFLLALTIAQTLYSILSYYTRH
ncbi:hypothetical protein EJ110_NYTH46899 [Nymphaea thermarum]|nr:hypothetical protein EJ110_NYTH46899 [Nymphaea thermarum]